jgi:tRNA(Ile)-lysidine synthase
LKLPFHARGADDAPGKGVSVEAWATVARMNAANDVRKSIGARMWAEGHTLNDQAETILLNLIRGGGLEAITGIWPGGAQEGSTIVQPLIDVERDEIVVFCRALHLRPRRDPTNEDTRLLRNAIRIKVLPAIERGTGRDVTRSIARSGDLLRADRMELHGAAIHALSTVLEGPLNGPRDLVRLDAEALRSLPKPIASRVVRLAVYNVMASDDVAPWTREAVEAVLDLAGGRVGRRRDLPNGLKARREQEYVSVSRTSPESRV